MKSKIRIKQPRRGGLSRDLGQIMKCLCTGEQLRKVDKMIPSSESLAAKDYSLSGYSSKVGVPEKKPDTRNIEEAELSLRESSSLNYEVCFFSLFSALNLICRVILFVNAVPQIWFHIAFPKHLSIPQLLKSGFRSILCLFKL